MEYNTDREIVLNSLNKDRKEHLDKVADIYKLFKKIKYGTLNLGLSKETKLMLLN